MIIVTQKTKLTSLFITSFFAVTGFFLFAAPGTAHATVNSNLWPDFLTACANTSLNWQPLTNAPCNFPANPDTPQLLVTLSSKQRIDGYSGVPNTVTNAQIQNIHNYIYAEMYIYVDGDTSTSGHAPIQIQRHAVLANTIVNYNTTNTPVLTSSPPSYDYRYDFCYIVTNKKFTPAFPFGRPLDTDSWTCDPVTNGAGPKTYTVPLVAGVYDSTINKTVYQLSTKLRNVKSFYSPFYDAPPGYSGRDIELNQTLRFKLVKQADVDYGFKSGSYIPLEINTSKERFYKMNVTFQTCTAVTGLINGGSVQNFRIYDADNFTGSGAQSVETAPGSNVYSYEAMEVGLKNGNTLLPVLPANRTNASYQAKPASPPGPPAWFNITPTGGAPGSPVTTRIGYPNLSSNTKYRWYFQNIGDGNFFALQAPMDQIPNTVNCPPILASKFTPQVTGNSYELGSNANIPITFRLNYKCEATATYNVGWSVSAGPGLAASSGTTAVNCVNGAPATGVNVGPSSIPTPLAAYGAYKPGDTAQYQLSITSVDNSGTIGTPNPATGTVQVFSVPYARFYGNDITASGCNAASGTATAPLDGRIVLNRKTANVVLPAPTVANNGIAANTYEGAGGDYGGAAVEYAAIAYSAYNTVITGSFQSKGSTAVDPKGSYVNRPVRLFAQWSASNVVCASNIVTAAKQGLSGLKETETIPADGKLQINGASNTEARFVNSTDAALNVTINEAGAVTAKGKQTIYSAGKMRIANNIVADKPAPFDNDTATVVLLITDGDVFIDSAVTQLDAIIVTPGNIYTCGNGTFTPRLQKDVYQTADTSCAKKLIVNGSLLANYIHFQRTNGTRLLAPDATNSHETSTNRPAGSTSNDTAAESISFPAYMYYATPHLFNASGSSFQNYSNPAPYF